MGQNGNLVKFKIPGTNIVIESTKDFDTRKECYDNIQAKTNSSTFNF